MIPTGRRRRELRPRLAVPHLLADFLLGDDELSAGALPGVCRVRRQVGAEHHPVLPARRLHRFAYQDADEVDQPLAVVVLEPEVHTGRANPGRVLVVRRQAGAVDLRSDAELEQQRLGPVAPPLPVEASDQRCNPRHTTQLVANRATVVDLGSRQDLAKHVVQSNDAVPPTGWPSRAWGPDATPCTCIRRSDQIRYRRTKRSPHRASGVQTEVSDERGEARVVAQAIVRRGVDPSDE